MDLKGAVAGSYNWETAVEVAFASTLEADFPHPFLQLKVTSGHTLDPALSSSFQILCWLAKKCD